MKENFNIVFQAKQHMFQSQMIICATCAEMYDGFRKMALLEDSVVLLSVEGRGDVLNCVKSRVGL